MCDRWTLSSPMKSTQIRIAIKATLKWFSRNESPQVVYHEYLFRCRFQAAQLIKLSYNLYCTTSRIQYYRSRTLERNTIAAVNVNTVVQKKYTQMSPLRCMLNIRPGSNYNTTIWFCCSHISGRPPLDREITTNRILTLSNHILTFQSYVAVCTGTGNGSTLHSASNYSLYTVHLSIVVQ